MGRVVGWAVAGLVGLLVLVAATAGGVISAFSGGDGAHDAALPLSAGFTLSADTPPPVVTAIGWALAQLGTPYTFGGDCTAPHSDIPAHQCDCSSLMQQAYRAGGIRLPPDHRTAGPHWNRGHRRHERPTTR